MIGPIVQELVRWPGKSGGAIGFALIFLSLFLSRKKVNNKHKQFRCGCKNPNAVDPFGIRFFNARKSSLLLLQSLKVCQQICKILAAHVLIEAFGHH